MIDAVESLGLTHERIAARLGEVMQAALEAFGNPVRLGAVASDAMGSIPCPWGGCGVFAKGEIELTNAQRQDTSRDPSVNTPDPASRILPGQRRPIPPRTGGTGPPA